MIAKVRGIKSAAEENGLLYQGTLHILEFLPVLYTCGLRARLGWQPEGVWLNCKRAHFLYATYLIRLSMHGITLPSTPTFPLRRALSVVQ